MLRRKVINKDRLIAVEVRRPRQLLAIRRIASCLRFNLLFGEPPDLLAHRIEQRDILIAISSVRRNQQLLPIRSPCRGRIKMLARMRSQVRRLACGYIDDEDIGIFPRRLRLRKCDLLPVGRPDRLSIEAIFGRIFRHFADAVRQHIERCDLSRRRIFRPHSDCQQPAMRLPRRRLLRYLRRVGQVHHVAILRRNHEDIPLLVAILVRLKRDPLSIG